MVSVQSFRRTRLSTAIGLTLSLACAESAWSLEIDLSELVSGQAMRLDGDQADDQAGKSVAGIGDINGDGFDDLIIGAPYASPGSKFEGSAFVVFGSDQALPASKDLGALNGSDGFRINGIEVFDFTGTWVSNAGDVNGDGTNDLIIGASSATPELVDYAGAAYVVFGSDEGFPATLSLGDLDGENGFAIYGTTPYSETGASVSDAGDFNGDGFDDVIVGAFFAGGGAGRAYVIFGSDQAWDASLTVDDLDGSNGLVLTGVLTGDSAGSSVGGNGDINGDGISDVLIGAPLAGPAGTNPGHAYVVFGDDGVLSSPISLANLNGSNGFVIIGESTGDLMGEAVAVAGDLNQDGVDDLILGAPGQDTNGVEAGAAYVVFGDDSAWLASFALSSLNGSNGFELPGIAAGDEAGKAVAAAGDIDGDTVDDLVMGAPGADPVGSESGASYVVFGDAGAWPASIDLDNLGDDSGFTVSGAQSGDESGSSVAAGGDINSDGAADLLIGAPLADTGGDASGAAWVLFDYLAVDESLIFRDGFE